jgi:hypothetical protein
MTNAHVKSVVRSSVLSEQGNTWSGKKHGIAHISTFVNCAFGFSFIKLCNEVGTPISFDVQRDFTFHEQRKILPQALGFLDDQVAKEKVQKLAKTVRPNFVNKIGLSIELMVIELKLDNAWCSSCPWCPRPTDCQVAACLRKLVSNICYFDDV